MIDALAVMQKIHGIVGALAIASCLHPVITVHSERVPGPRVRLSAWLAALLTLLSFGLGLTLYSDYRILVKPWLLAHAATYHLYWFETKEITGYFTLCAAGLGAAILHFGRGHSDARRASKMLYAFAFIGGLFTASSGIIVASVKGF
ncbi:MAG: hypothetical protein VX223_15440 [Myxococcota bacterium]|nr:hypothetical protein [Myxococcota bacterium]